MYKPLEIVPINKINFINNGIAIWLTVMNEVPENYKSKVDELNKILLSKNPDINRLRDLAISDGGLVISK